MNLRFLLVGLSFLLFNSSCGIFNTVKKSEQEIKAREIFKGYTDAYNNRDISKLISYFADDFAWISIKPKVFETILRGRAQLIESYDKYYKTYPNVKTKILDLTYDEGYIWTKELVTWKVGKEEFTQFVNAVYYIEKDKIQRLWYFDPDVSNQSTE